MKKYTRATAQDVFRMYRVLWGTKSPERYDMKSKYFATLEDGIIVSTTDGTSEVKLKDNQIPLTSDELEIIRVVDGDLEYAKNIIRAIENRVKSATPAPLKG